MFMVPNYGGDLLEGFRWLTCCLKISHGPINASTTVDVTQVTGWEDTLT